MKSLDILLCIDRNFVLGAGALIASILKNNPEINFLFHVFTKEEDVAYLGKELFGRLKANSEFSKILQYKIYIASELPLFKRLQQSGINMRRIMQSIRLFAPPCCETISDRILYMDADILCLGSLSSLTEFNLENNTFAATPWDINENSAPTKVEGKYLVKKEFCSGVMLINTEAWKKDNNEAKLIDFIISERPKYIDQTALNVLYDGNYTILPNVYDSINVLNNSTVLLHYVSQKLWEPWYFKQSSREILSAFRKYAKLFEPDVTKWISFKKDRKVLINFSSKENPESRFANKWMSKLMLRRGNLSAGIYFRLYHIYLKIKTKGFLGLILLKSNTKS